MLSFKFIKFIFEKDSCEPALQIKQQICPDQCVFKGWNLSVQRLIASAGGDAVFQAVLGVWQEISNVVSVNHHFIYGKVLL